MPGTPFRAAMHKQGKINRGANIIMQKHCRWNSVSSVRERMLWFVYIYSFVDSCARSCKQCKSGKMLATYVSARFFFLESLTHLAPRASTYTPFLSLHIAVLRISIAFCEVASGESPTKKDCRQHGIRHVDKWGSSLSCQAR